MKFTELKLNDKLMQGIADAGFTTMMPVQEMTLGPALEGRDVEVQSQTGTGKTAAFLITIFQHFLDPNSPIERKKAMILAPTRELAVQIEKDAKLLGKHLDFTIGCFYGGVGYQKQEQLIRDDVDLIIGTPGRLLDFSYQKKLDFRELGFLVIDEADRMLDMGFIPDIRRILRRMGDAGGHRQIMLFSATLDVDARSIGREFMDQPATIEIEPEQITVDKITQIIYHVAEREKINLILGIFKKELPKNALIFTNMKHTAAQVAKHLEYNGYKCLYLSGDLPQSKRLSIINKFKSGQLPYLVATDVAARGLHIEDLELIINYDLPGDCENYVHRIGRTARAGKSGKAISLACENFVYNLEAIENYIGIKIPVAVAGEDMFSESKSEGMDFRRERRTGTTARASRPRGKTARKKSPSRPKKSGGKKGHEQEAKSKHKKKKDQFKDKQKDRQKDKYKDKQKQQERGRSKGKGKSAAQTQHKEPANRKHPSKKKKSPAKKAQKTVANTGISTFEDRLEYYRKKYGDNFKGQDGQKPAPPQKQSLLNRVKSFFKKK